MQQINFSISVLYLLLKQLVNLNFKGFAFNKSVSTDKIIRDNNQTSISDYKGSSRCK